MQMVIINSKLNLRNELLSESVRTLMLSERK